MSKRLLCLAAGLCLATGAAACNLNKFTADTTAGMLEYGSITLDRESDLEFARGAFPASLKTLETFLISSPENESLLLLLARGYNSYAFAILEGDLEKAKLTGPEEKIESLNRRSVIHYLRGREYGFRLLNKPKLEKAARDGKMDALKSELGKLKKEETPGLFWAVYGWASAVNLSQSDSDMVASLPTIELMLERVLELDPHYLDGLPLVFEAVYNASRPPMFGGKPDKAKQYFDRAMKEHGSSNLLVPYLYARFYCTQVQNRELFDELIAKVQSADLTKYPDLRLNNEVARDRAKFWSAHVDELIFEE